MPAPKAKSQGSKGAGGGTLALTAMSAAIAELAVTANTAAASTSFFITIPISILEQPGFVAPRNRKTDCDQISRLIWSARCDQRSKKPNHLPTFKPFRAFCVRLLAGVAIAPQFRTLRRSPAAA